MAESSKKESIRNTTLYTLIKHIALTPQEVAQLRLSDLHLAGKSPNIHFTPPDSEEPKTVELDLDAHRSLVGWLVARPDSASDFLFPGQGTDPLDWQIIQQQVEQIDQEAADGEELESAAAAVPPPVAPATDAPVDESKPTPPRSAPELGTPPPGMAAMPPGSAMPGAFTPPTSGPESGEPANMPLPSSMPPPRPPEPLPTHPPEKPGPKAVAQKSPTAYGKTPPVVPTAASKLDKTPAATKSKTTGRFDNLPRVAMIGAALVVLLLCGGCLVGSWLMWQSEAGSQLLASLGITGTTEDFPNDVDIVASLTPPTPLPTSTLPPTSTATPLPATDTPEATPTETPVPVDTPVPATNTPEGEATPTETPVIATDTPTPEEPAETPTPVDSPTPAMKYESPKLQEPDDGAAFIEGNIILLKWQSVGELASDEQYAVRLVYLYEGQPTYQGTNLRETEWAVPPSLHGQIDGPDNLYEWFVIVERLNDDGSGTAISPESEHRNFTWK